MIFNKKVILYLVIATLITSGCRNASSQNNENTRVNIENSTQITIGYGFNSHIVVITDASEIKQIEALFNGKEFVASDKSTQMPYLTIVFEGEEDTTLNIDKNNVILLNDAAYYTSEQIQFDDFYEIYDDKCIKPSD